MLQTGARLVWDIEFGNILSLASEAPSDVRLEYQGSKWAIKTSQTNVIAKTCDDRVHSSGSSSQNVVASLPKLDVRQTLAKFPPIDTHGDSTPMVMCTSVTNASYRLLRHDQTLCRIRSPVPEVKETPRHCSRGNGRHLDPICFRSVSADQLSSGFRLNHFRTLIRSASDYVFNPVLLDACFHYALHPTIAQATDDRSIFLPSKLRKFAFYAAPGPGSLVYSHYVLREWTPGG